MSHTVNFTIKGGTDNGNGGVDTNNLLIIGAGVTAVAIGAMAYLSRKKR